MPTPNNSDDLKLSLEHRIDAVCSRFEAAWKAGQQPNLEEFLAGWEGPEQAALEKELRLINIDYLTRAKAPEQSQSARNPVATGDFNPPTMTYIGDATVTFTGEARPAAVSNDLPNLGLIAGRYRLIKKIADGGMGSVYLAEQTHPIKRRVALKLIKSGIDSRSVLARFDAERQALALMDHPNIARIYDGGLTESYFDPEGRHVHGGGQPFFVMELVEGVPMTEYCDTKRLTIDARLQLFILVCMAVQHAHQKGIIHRDLKPGNVLVTEVDGKPTPKVIDFGVAKATEQKLTDLSYIDSGIIVGTPAYMSPEQADPEEYDVDTRSDVYALGVMLMNCSSVRCP